MLAVSYVAAALHAKMLLDKGESRSDVEVKIVNTATTVMILGVLISLFAWPAGKTTWYQSKLFKPAYDLSCKYMKAPPGYKPPRGVKADDYYRPIRCTLIAAITSIICGVLAGVVVRATKDSLVNQSGGGGRGGPPAGGPKSPWSGRSY